MQYISTTSEMAYTFHSIPAEAVVSDEATWTVIRSTIKCPDNMEICKACMGVIEQKYTNDPNPYKAQAYRRAAILVANVDFPLISQKGEEAVSSIKANKIGLPNFGKTITFIHDYVMRCLLTDKLKKNIYEAFPPAWRGNLLEDDARINRSLEVLDFFVNKPYMWTIYSQSTGPTQEAFQYYLGFYKSERPVLMNHIKNFVMEACC